MLFTRGSSGPGYSYVIRKPTLLLSIDSESDKYRSQAHSLECSRAGVLLRHKKVQPALIKRFRFPHAPAFCSWRHTPFRLRPEQGGRGDHDGVWQRHTARGGGHRSHHTNKSSFQPSGRSHTQFHIRRRFSHTFHHQFHTGNNHSVHTSHL